jgi:hypothetical protein
MSRPTFTVTFTADDTDGIRGVRALLKLRGADSDYAPSTCANINTHLASVRRAVWVSVRRQEQVTCH